MMDEFATKAERDDSVVATAKRAEALSHAIRPLLQGQGADAQGAALADLVSMWIASHHPELRDGVLRAWVDVVQKLIPESEKEIFGTPGFPRSGLS
jgi:hypothetical protein